MTSRRKRRQWTDEQRARALAVARARGAAAAEAEVGVPSGTVRSWLNRAGDAPETLEAQIAVGEALEADQAGKLPVDAFAALQHRIVRQIDLELVKGDALSVQRMSEGLGIVTDKLDRKREAERPSSSGTGADDFGPTAERLDDLLKDFRVRKLRLFAALGVDDLRVEIGNVSRRHCGAAAPSYGPARRDAAPPPW